MLKIRPINRLQVYLSTKKDGSIVNKSQAEKLLAKNGCRSSVIYFKHQHQAQRFYLHKKNNLSAKICADAVISQQQKLCLAMSVADCFPLIIAAPQKNIFALLHAGWKPLFQNIIELTVLDLKYLYQLKAESLIAWIGPGIRKCCYRFKEKPVQADLAQWQEAITVKKNFWQIDLPTFIKNELMRLNFNNENIFDFEACTCCEESTYFSHQRSKKTKEANGRIMIGVESNT